MRARGTKAGQTPWVDKGSREGARGEWQGGKGERERRGKTSREGEEQDEDWMHCLVCEGPTKANKQSWLRPSRATQSEGPNEGLGFLSNTRAQHEIEGWRRRAGAERRRPRLKTSSGGQTEGADHLDCAQRLDHQSGECLSILDGSQGEPTIGLASLSGWRRTRAPPSAPRPLEGAESEERGQVRGLLARPGGLVQAPDGGGPIRDRRLTEARDPGRRAAVRGLGSPLCSVHPTLSSIRGD